MSNSRFVQSLLWALHNNYVAKYGLKNLTHINRLYKKDILYSEH